MLCTESWAYEVYYASGCLEYPHSYLCTDNRLAEKSSIYDCNMDAIALIDRFKRL